MSYPVPTPKSTAVPYYTPAPEFPITQAVETTGLPKMFQPLKIKGLTLPNRIGVSPLCMYSTDDNLEITPWHLVHYGSFATNGVGLTIVEASTVSKEGALSPHDSALYTDNQAKKYKDVVDFVHSQKGIIGVQIGHGGRKASGRPLWEALEEVAPKEDGGWPDEVVAPSAIAYRPYGNYHVPKELSISEIEDIVNKFGSAAKRAVEISGFDFIEIHGAHGYLINEFLSATSNKRTDKYGGSFENRTRFLIEIIKSIKANVPESTPLFLRISASEGVDEEGAWTIDDSIKLAPIVVELGIDVIDVSSAGNNYKQLPRAQQHQPRYRGIGHEHLAAAIKKAVGDTALVACVGGLGQDSKITNSLLEEGIFDIALIGSAFLKDRSLTWRFARELGVATHQAPQYGWPSNPKREGIVELIKRTHISAAADGVTI